MKRRTKASRAEAFRCHAQGYPTRTPGWARINPRITLSPEGWAKFCDLIGMDAATGMPSEAP